MAAKKFAKIAFPEKLNSIVETVHPIPPIIPAGIKDFTGELKNIENPIVAKD